MVKPITMISIMITIAMLSLVGVSGNDAPLSTARVIAAFDQVSPGGELPLAVVFTMAEGWHTYAEEPGDAGMPPDIRISGPDGLETGSWRFPPAQVFTDDLGSYYGYEGQVALIGSVKLPAVLPVGQAVELAVALDWMICLDICVLLRDSQTLTITMAEQSGEAGEEWQKILEAGGWSAREKTNTEADASGKE